MLKERKNLYAQIVKRYIRAKKKQINAKNGVKMMYDGFYGYGMMHPFGFGTSILWLAVIALVIWWVYQSSRASNGEDSALNILKARYAKGEITKKQFEDMKRKIK